MDNEKNSLLISDLTNICSEPTTLFKEGLFETVKLIGKEMNTCGSAITYLMSMDYMDSFLEEQTECVICTIEIAKKLNNQYSGGIAVSKNPKTSFFEIHNYFASKNSTTKPNCIAKSAQIHPTAIIEENGVTIGEDTIICANVIIKSGSKIGNNCTLREGVVIGTPGFYYYGEGDNKRLVESTGGVILGNNVELHPHTTVEKGVLNGNTVIDDNSKLDNLILIGHDSKIGKNCIIAAGTTFAGGVEFGDDAFAGVGVTIAPYVKVGKGAKLSSGAVATKNVNDYEHVSGNFAIEHSKFIQNLKQMI